MNRQKLGCLITLWVALIINLPLLIFYFLSSGIIGLIVLIALIAGAITLTIFWSRDKSGIKKYNKELNNRASALRYEKTPQYVMCPECKHIVDKELNQCEYCGHQM